MIKLKSIRTLNKPILSVLKFYTERETVIQKLLDLGDKNVDVLVDINGTNKKVIIKRIVPADVPKALKKFMQPSNRVNQTELWKFIEPNTYKCNLEIDIVGVPVDIRGSILIIGDEQQCTVQSLTEVSSGVPILGKLIAKFIADETEKTIEEEIDYIDSQI